MDEQVVRWVTKAEAAAELDVSLSTLDRKIRNGEVEVRREDRRVFVRMEGEYITDDELLLRSLDRENELERTVRVMEQQASELEHRASEKERERDEARASASADRQVYAKLGEAYRKECTAHGQTRWLAFRLGLVAAGLFVLLVGSVLLWWFLPR